MFYIESGVADKECRLLQKLVRKCPKGAIVEIGSWKGKSAVWMGEEARKRGMKVYAIDPCDNYDGADFNEIKANIEKAGLADTVIPIQKYSYDAAPDFKEPIALLFIDGDHTYESVRKDFEDWFPKIVENGWVAFHDSVGYEGVKKFVDEASIWLSSLGLTRSITYGQPPPPPSTL